MVRVFPISPLTLTLSPKGRGDRSGRKGLPLIYFNGRLRARESLDAADDFHDFVGDPALTGAVVFA